ncbi:hypothetical protein [Asticcacaulis machinosus]|uniref:Uncharacterized protein n=1 Tax=Asticcacaulis machinosus TaxID=2984211 RepID=A0ABT5HHQ8_9CAUL|nr:hypothetical protein [Asticcacaulis machinosus]MDC7675779.1 hypothetical protein [Asticcacaulis machinosus]
MTIPLNRAPWHCWLIGALWAVWNVLAASDYIFSVTQREAYYRASGMTEAQVAYFSALPLWVTGAWTLSVWAGVISAGLFILRRGSALWGVVLSLLGTTAYGVYLYALSAGIAATGDMWFMPALIGVLMGALILYIRTLIKRNVLYSQ